MSGNLPPTLPGGAGGGAPLRPQVSAHAQNMQTSRLSQHKERSQATTSIGHVGEEAADKTASTSVAHPGGSRQAASTSVAHPGYAPAVGEDGYNQEAADRRRYAHIRKMMKEKKAQEEQGVNVGTGGAYRGKRFRKAVGKLIGAGGRGLTKKDKAMMKGVIKDRAQSKRTGESFDYKDKKKMSREMYDQMKSGKISRGKFDRFKNILRGLD